MLAGHDLDVWGGLSDAAVGGRDDGAGVVHGAAAAVAIAADDAAELRGYQARFRRAIWRVSATKSSLPLMYFFSNEMKVQKNMTLQKYISTYEDDTVSPT